MLLGQHDHALDEKNRLTLPAKLREQLGDHVVVTRGLEGCLNVYAAKEWEALAGRVTSLDPLSRDGRQMRRFFFTGAAHGELDKQGRMVLPTSLLKGVGIEREVTVAGMYDHLEIWDRTKWQSHLQEVEGSAEDVAERLAN
ncbi:MAG TPA: division/cell wall cluster transcriptional repressor MraZ [Gaiellaceae bacterium]|jgi:MraZ protein